MLSAVRGSAIGGGLQGGYLETANVGIAKKHSMINNISDSVGKEYIMGNISHPTLPAARLVSDGDWLLCNNNITIDAFTPSELVFLGGDERGVAGDRRA